MVNKAIAAAAKFLDTNIMPILKEITSLENVIIVIGGSLSYGFFDKESDVDVYILWELPREKWFEKLKEYLFVHKVVDSFRIQYIPIDLHNVQYIPLSCLFNDNFNNLSKIDDIKLLYAILHFIPILDTRNAVKKAQEYIRNLGNDYWKEKCIEHCCKHIDVLEAFYSWMKECFENDYNDLSDKTKEAFKKKYNEICKIVLGE